LSKYKKLIRELHDGSNFLPSQPSLSYSSRNSIYSPTKLTTNHPEKSVRYFYNRKPQSINYFPKQRQVHYIQKPQVVNKNIITTNPSLIFINTFINNKPIRAMIDTGASHTFITQRALRTLSYFRLPPCQRTAQLGDGQTTLTIIGEVQLLLQFDQVFTPVNVLVVQTMNTDFILGGDWCIQNKATIDYAKYQVSICTTRGRVSIPYDKNIDQLTLDVKSINVIHIPPRESCTVQAKVELSSAKTVYFSPADATSFEKDIVILPGLLHVNNYITYLEIYNPQDIACTLPMNTCLGQITHTPYKVQSCVVFDPTRSLSTRSSQQHVSNTIELKQSSSETHEIIHKLLNHIINFQDNQQLHQLLEQHKQIFDISHATQANTTVQHIINTGDSLPISSRPYPRTVQQRRELQAEVQKMLEAKQIRPSNSPWSSPVIIHKKKDGGIRFLVDYRKLNSVTKKDCFPQPTTEELLHRLGGHCFYSKLDLKSGYFQVPIHETDKEKTAFITQDGLWEFNVLPQGIMNGPPTFQRTMHNLLGYGRWDYGMAYLDDILIFSHTFDEHVKHLYEILSILANANFQVNPDKCFIAVQEIDFLGHTINEHGIKPNGEKIKAIVDLPPPTTLKEANEFLGKINWYRKFIPNFARTAAPLHKITNKTKHRRHEFKWGPEQQQSFVDFKSILTTHPLFLEYPDLSTPFTLTTDASDIGIGGILRQDTPNGTKINYYKSRVLNDTERKYDTFEKEALAIYWCITELRSYIGDSNFIVETDHEPLANFHLKQINNKRVMNWIFKLQDILPQIITVKYRKGANNAAADYISRHFSSSTSGDPTLSSDRALPSTTAAYNSNTFDNVEINAVTTRAQAKRIVPLRSQTPTTVQPPYSSPSTGTQLYDFSLSRIRTEQTADVNIQNIIQQIHNSRRYSSFTMQDDVLYKLVHRDNTVIKLIYTPAKLIPDLLNAYHDHPLSGHFGISRTWSQLRNAYYWPRMKETIMSYIKSCDKCSQFNVDRRKPPGFLQPIQPPNDVFQILGMDWWGPATPSLAGNRYVLVVTDRLSGYVFAAASPTNTAQDTARILIEKVILVHGPPDILITDQGGHFKNELLQAISKLVGCTHVFSTPYHPQTNGQTERWNSTFVTQLAKFCNADQNNWDTYLPSIVYAYNNGIHNSTGFTPYQLAFGRQPRHPFTQPNNSFNFTKPHDYWSQVLQYRNNALQQAKRNILHQQQLSKTRFDKNRSHPCFVPGDLV